MTTLPPRTQALAAYLADLHHLAVIYHTLFWDQNVMMPPGGAEARATQMALVQRLRHERLIADEAARLIAEAEAEVAGLEADSDAARLVAVARAEHDYALALPADFVADYSHLTARAFDVWRQAKANDDYAAFKPMLARIYEMKLQEADLRGYDDHPYDVFLGHWERGLTTRRVRELFDQQRERLIALAAAVNAHGDRVDNAVLRQSIPLDQQREVAAFVSTALGVDYAQWARLDTAPHPFCLQLARDDLRITTAYTLDEPGRSLYGTMHETGHALHGRGIAPSLDGTWLSDMESYSHALAESQSRTWENLVGRSRAFWRWLTPHLQQRLPDFYGDSDAETLYRAANRSFPQLYRTRADELTYNLHIMLRFDVELAWVEGRVGVDDLPELWRETFRRYFGIVPATDAEGVMQDVHWAMGGIGAFNGYAIGNVMASQFYAAAQVDLPDLDDAIAQGQFAPLREWLTERIYRHGRKFDAETTMQRVTGGPIHAAAYLDYLEAKFSDLYAL